MSVCQEDISKQAKLMRGKKKKIRVDPEDRIRFQVCFLWEAIQENNFGLK